MIPAAACRNVIFDLDGTLLDSRPGIVAGLRHTLRHLGHDLPADASLDWAIGPPLPDVMARLLGESDAARVRQAVECYRDWYGAVGVYDASPYPGVPELLDGLAAAGKSLFVGTSKRIDLARRALGHFGLAPRFRAVHGVGLDGQFARKTDLIRHLLDAEGLDAAETIVVGDREQDVAAARACGLCVAGATWGYGGRAELAAAGANVLFDSPGDLLAQLGATSV
jgi:phosphoglycolate phosphatase